MTTASTRASIMKRGLAVPPGLCGRGGRGGRRARGGHARSFAAALTRVAEVDSLTRTLTRGAVVFDGAARALEASSGSAARLVHGCVAEISRVNCVPEHGSA